MIDHLMSMQATPHPQPMQILEMKMGKSFLLHIVDYLLTHQINVILLQQSRFIGSSERLFRMERCQWYAIQNVDTMFHLECSIYFEFHSNGNNQRDLNIYQIYI